MRTLAAYLMALLLVWLGCASMPERKLMPVMGLHEEEEEKTPAEGAGTPAEGAGSFRIWLLSG